MSTQLFKDGESIWLAAKSVQRHIDAGWSPDDPDLIPPPALKIIPPHLHVGHIPLPPDKDKADAALLAMGIDPEPIKIGAMHVPV